LILKIIKKRYMELSIFEEDMWRQRLHTKWAIEGESKYTIFSFNSNIKKKKPHKSC
jgi:hypothetical protein